MSKVALVATRVFAPEPIPAAFRNEQLARALSRAGFDTQVLTSNAPGADASPQGAKQNFSISRWPVKRDRQGQIRGYFSYLSFDIPLFFRLLVRQRASVMISEPPPTTGLVVMLASAIKRVPYVFYAADIWSDATDSVEGVPGIVKWAVRAAEKLVWKRAAVVLTISDGVNARIAELIGDRPQLAMISNGIDTETFTPDGPRASEEGPYFVYAGTISEWQGAGVLVEAFRIVSERNPRARLLFFAEGQGRDSLEKMCAEHAISGVEFRGRVPAAEVATYLRGAVAGLSSITPNIGYDFALPTKIYAAGACGVPVIHAGAIDSAASVRIRDNNLGYAPGAEPEALAEAMLNAIEQQERVDRVALREWTVNNASLSASADRAAERISKIAK